MLVFYFMEWKAVYYNGLETNIEVTKCGRVKRVKVDWLNYNWKTKLGEVDFNKLKLSPQGYKQLTIQIKGLKQRSVQVQQLISAAFFGYQWKGNSLVVDHIDSNKLNNHIDNLRVVTIRENSSKEKTFKSGLPVGVNFFKRDKKYQSRIYINRKHIHLGLFNTIEEASYAYQQKLKTI